MRFTCGGCTSTWGGLTRAHCSGCHLTFSTAGNFDKHRRSDSEYGHCLPPATVDLAESEGLWRSPGREPGDNLATWWRNVTDVYNYDDPYIENYLS